MSKMSVNLIMDSWLREAEEASQWAEDLQSRINHTNGSVVDSAPSISKLSELGVKLDRLESLLRNPPTKPILTDEDLDFRWKMLSDIQLRTRNLARTLYALPSPNRPRIVPATPNREHNINNSADCSEQVVDQLRNFNSQDHSELLKPLLSDDESRSQIMPMISLWKACSTIVLFLGLAALLCLVVLLCTSI